jgi:hypothetical protein
VSAPPPAKKTAGLIEKGTKVLKIPNLKHHLILKLGQINLKFQYSMTETGLEFRSLAMFHTSAAAGLKNGQSDRKRNSEKENIE